jgi:flagellar basal-body rod protein FlgB
VRIFSQSTSALESALSTAALKQKTISSNIANVDTPNYKSKYVQADFQSLLNNEVDKQKSISSVKTNPQHLPFSTETAHSQAQSKVVTNNQTTFSLNGNNVDMDYEMAQLAKNQLWYNALIERTNGKFNSLRTVINDGR